MEASNEQPSMREGTKQELSRQNDDLSHLPQPQTLDLLFLPVCQSAGCQLGVSSPRTSDAKQMKADLSASTPSISASSLQLQMLGSENSDLISNWW